TLNFQSSLPSVASNAWNQPLISPWNTKFPAVVIVPPLNGNGCLTSQTLACLTGSQAIRSPPEPPGPGRKFNSAAPTVNTPRLKLVSPPFKSMQVLLLGI